MSTRRKLELELNAINRTLELLMMDLGRIRRMKDAILVYRGDLQEHKRVVEEALRKAPIEG